MRVLIVDDAEDIAKLLCLTLESEDVETIPWTDHFDAITSLVDWHRVDAVIVDQLLGIYDGRQLLKWLERYHPGIRRVMLTADSRVKIAETHAQEVLIKPASPDAIRSAVYER